MHSKGTRTSSLAGYSAALAVAGICALGMGCISAALAQGSPDEPNVITSGDWLSDSNDKPAAPPPAATPNTALPPVVVPPAGDKTKKPATASKPKAAKTAAAKDPTADIATGKARAGQSIIALVNDEPITAYEIEQRQRLLGMSAGGIQEKAQANFKALIKAPGTSERLKAILNEVVEANKGKSREDIIEIFEKRKKEFAISMQRQALDTARSSVLPGLKKQAMDELIEERLKLQEAKRLNVVAGDDDVDKIIKGIAERNKMSETEFAEYVKKGGGDLSAMKSWNEVVRRKYGQQVAISERDVDRFVEKAPAAAVDDNVDLQVQRVTLPIVGKPDQKQVAQRLAEAEMVAAGFKGCLTTAVAAQVVAGAKFEDLGTMKPSKIGEPTRSLLLSAKDGDILPPSVGGGGVELWIVCGRQVGKANEERRQNAQAELRQREFEVLARKAMKDLRQDASIEYR
jgi:peptidyl-prolyl cis-trans isomerase SurA